MLTQKYFTVISILLQYNSHIKNEEDILSYSPTAVMFRGTPCTLHCRSLHLFNIHLNSAMFKKNQFQFY